MYLVKMDQPCVLLLLLIPCIDKVEHNHTYAQRTSELESTTDQSILATTIPCSPPTAEQIDVNVLGSQENVLCLTIKEKVHAN